MAQRSYFGKMNSTLGSVVPLAMFSKGPNFQTVPIFAFMSFFQIPQKLGLLPAELPPAQLVGDLHSIGRRPRPNDHT